MKKRIRVEEQHLEKIVIQELDDGKVGRVVASCEDTALEGSLNIWACVNVRDCCDATNLIDCMP